MILTEHTPQILLDISVNHIYTSMLRGNKNTNSQSKITHYYMPMQTIIAGWLDGINDVPKHYNHTTDNVIYLQLRMDLSYVEKQSLFPRLEQEGPGIDLSWILRHIT